MQEANTQESPSWRALDDLAQCNTLLQANVACLTLSHINREVLKLPHDLANLSRRTRTSFDGKTDEWCQGVGPVQTQHKQLPPVFQLVRKQHSE